MAASTLLALHPFGVSGAADHLAEMRQLAASQAAFRLADPGALDRRQPALFEPVLLPNAMGGEHQLARASAAAGG